MSDQPNGLFYYSNVVPMDLGTRLEKFLDSDCELFPVPGRGGVVSSNARYVAHYGYRYDYRRGKISIPAAEFPQILQEVRSLIYRTHQSFPDGHVFDQCIINRYLPGQGISAHYDREEYGEYIACFTLGGGAEMEFTDRVGHGRYTIFTEPYSLYIMSGPARHEWLHQMRSRKSDPGHGQRSTRWSLTFRSVQS